MDHRRFRFRLLPCAALLGLAAAWAGCAGETGGQTGDEDSLPAEVSIPGGTSDCPCQHDPVVRLAGLDDAPAGVAARDMLALVALDGPMAIRWQRESEWDWEAPRVIEAAGQAPAERVVIDVAYGGGEIRYAGPTGCFRMDVEVEVSLQSEDGALDERVTAWLHAGGSNNRGLATDPVVSLALLLHRPETTFRGATSTAQDCMPMLGIAPLMGTLDVRTTLEQRAPDDPIDGPWSLSQRARLVVLPIDLRFSPGGVYGTMDAWMYGAGDGRLRRIHQIGVLGAR